MDRRQFLFAAGAGSAASVASANTTISAAVKRVAGAANDWAAVKSSFDPAPNIVQMAAFYLASHPKPVRDAIERHRRGLDREAHGYIHHQGPKSERGLRAAAAEYMAVDPDHLSQVGSTTAGLGLTYANLQMKPEWEILTDTRDHIVTRIAAMHGANRAGGSYRQAALYAEPAKVSTDEVVRNVRENLRDNTRLFGMTWVHSGTGVKMPVEAVGEVIAAHNKGKSDESRTLFAIDGVHGLGNQDVDIPAMGADFFIAGTHKWMNGPRGTGLIWAKPDAQAFIDRTIPTFDPMWREMPPQQMPQAAWHTPGGFHAFEHTWAVEDAFRWHLSLGRKRVAERIAGLNTMAKEGLSALPKVTLATPMKADYSAGIIAFDVAGWDPYEAVDKLLEKGVVASVVPSFYNPLYVRVAPSLMNDEDDVRRTVAAIAEL